MIENNIKIEKIEELFALIKKACNDNFTGYIQINFFQGGVTNLNKHESFKLGGYK